MGLIVQKFGGSSVADAERIHRAARRAIAAKEAGNQVVVVVSANGRARVKNLTREDSSCPEFRPTFVGWSLAG